MGVGKTHVMERLNARCMRVSEAESYAESVETLKLFRISGTRKMVLSWGGLRLLARVCEQKRS